MKLLFIFTLITSLGIIAFGNGGLLSAYRKSQEKAFLEMRLTSLKKENKKLVNKIKKFQSNPESVEHMIRKNLFLVAEDEIIFRFK